MIQNYTSLDEKGRFFSDNSVVNTAGQLDDKISELKRLNANNKLHVVFRGVCEAKYKLYTSLQRELFALHLSNANPIELVSSLVSSARKDGSKEGAWEKYFNALGIKMNDWLCLAMLQHYGAPTPLLDFSKSLETALFFMCKGMTNTPSDSEIDGYSSIVYYKIVDVCNSVTEQLPKTCKKIYGETSERPDISDQNAINSFISEKLSFSEIMRDKTIEIVTAYNKATIIAVNKKRGFALPITNMNMASQNGEFVCNVSPDRPIEELMVKNGVKYLYCLNIHKSLAQYIIKKYLGGALETKEEELFPSNERIAQQAYNAALAGKWVNGVES